MESGWCVVPVTGAPITLADRGRSRAPGAPQADTERLLPAGSGVLTSSTFAPYPQR